jgi:AAA family ATP:ADP antiporter
VAPAVAVAAAVEEAQVVDGDAEKTFGSRRLAKMVPPKEMKKLLPLALMFFCVLFNYTILRNTKVRVQTIRLAK